MTVMSRSHPDPATGSGGMVVRLLDLYRHELEIYRRVLALSERQGDLVRDGADFSEVRRVLEEKNRCLAVIARLENDEATTKSTWERERQDLPIAERGRVHRALQGVADLIEQILAVEEANDNDLIQRTGVLG